jgi:hypothetical protein
MTAAEIVSRLAEMGVLIVIPEPGRIKLVTSFETIPAEAVELAKPHKAALVAYLSRSCSPHNDPSNYIDAPAPLRHGWIKTTCRQCGKFIGHRRDEVAA